LKAEYFAKRKIISGLLLWLAQDQWLLQYTSFQKYCTGPPVGGKIIPNGMFKIMDSPDDASCQIIDW
jgi:hypothetical protein